MYWRYTQVPQHFCHTTREQTLTIPILKPLTARKACWSDYSAWVFHWWIIMFRSLKTHGNHGIFPWSKNMFCPWNMAMKMRMSLHCWVGNGWTSPFRHGESTHKNRKTIASLWRQCGAARAQNLGPGERGTAGWLVYGRWMPDVFGSLISRYSKVIQ